MKVFKRTNQFQFVVTVLFSIIAVALNYLISLELTRYITANISTEAYGFVSLAKTVSGYVSIFSIALNSFATRFISVEYHKENHKKANAYYNSIFVADMVLALIVFAVAIIVIANLQFFIKIPAELITDVKLLFLFDTCNFIIVSSSTVFLSAAVINNRLDIQNIFRCISYVSEAAALVICYSFFKPKVFYVGIGLVVSAFVILFTNALYSKKSVAHLKITRKNYSGKIVKEVVGSGIWNSINNLGNTLNTGLDLLITNLMLSPLATGQLAIVKTISTIFSSMFQLFAQPLQPLQLKYYANNDKKDLINSFKMGIKLNGMLSNIAFAGFAIFGLAYFRLWTPNENGQLLQAVTLITIIGSIIEGPVYPLYYTYTLTLKNKIPCIITVLSGLLNVTSMYFLIKYTHLGIYCVVGTTSVLTWLVNFIFNPLYSSHCLNIPLLSFYPTLIRDFISCGIITFIGFLISRIYYPDTWIGLIGVAILLIFIGFVIQSLIVFNRSERDKLFSFLIKRK
jgi:O-antigen/teichoic acid export membrane protein